MTNNIRVFLWLALGLAIYVNFSQWQMDYAPKPVVPTATTTTLPDGTVVASKPRLMSDTVPQAGQSTVSPDAAAVPQAAATAAPADSQPEVPADSTVHVKTDVLDLEISRIGGTLVKAVLPAYPVTKGQPDPVVLLNRNSLATRLAVNVLPHPGGPQITSSWGIFCLRCLSVSNLLVYSHAMLSRCNNSQQ